MIFKLNFHTRASAKPYGIDYMEKRIHPDGTKLGLRFILPSLASQQPIEFIRIYDVLLTKEILSNNGLLSGFNIRNKEYHG